MSNAKKEFFRIFGVRPRDIEPPMNQQQLWNMIHAQKQGKDKLNPLNLPKPEFTYSIFEVAQKNNDPLVVLERRSPDGQTIHHAFIFGKVDVDGVLKNALNIPEHLWCEPD
jgi:hypothetical protein